MSLVASTLSGLEALWIAVAVISFIVTAINLFDALKDRQALVVNGIFNGRRLISRVTLFTESTRLIIHGVFFSIGVMAALLPSPPEGMDIPTVQVVISYVIRWGLIFASLILMAHSIALRWMRHKLRGE